MKGLLLFFLLCTSILCAQNSFVEQLDTVVLKPLRLKEKSVGQTLLKISEKTVQNYRSQLTDVLNFESPIYFKENGLGMVSSPSFRGTTAQQTAVLWNGININSQFLGQTDFNTITTHQYSSIAIRPGGGSSQFGSGAIGGTVFLENNLGFNRGNTYSLRASAGSYSTYNTSAKVNISKKKYALQAGLTYYDSANDYEHFTSGRKNENGQITDFSVNVNGAYKINAKNKLSLYTEWFNGKRHFSILEPSQTKTKYHDKNLRTQLVWNSNFQKFSMTSRLAYLSEKFIYFPKLKQSENSSYGKAQSFIARYKLGYRPQKELYLESSVKHRYVAATGDEVDGADRNLSTFRLFAKYQLNSHWTYQVNLNTQYAKDFQNPLLYQLGTNYHISKHHELRANFSKNYRIPTLNDLYWPGAGNLNLKPETSHQVELSYLADISSFHFEVSLYRIHIQDMIRWLPGNGSVWKPINTDQVVSEGVEAKLNYQFDIGDHKFRFHGLYGYTSSVNRATKNQLIYVPYHKVAAGFSYAYKRLDLSMQNMYNGQVFTQSSNNPEAVVDAYWLSNLTASYTLGENADYTVGARVKNLWDRAYFNVDYKPMPGINFQFFITLTI